VLQAFVNSFIVTLPFMVLLIDGCIHTLVYVLIAVLLWKVIKYANFAVLTIFQRVINHIALAILSVSLWLGICFWLFYFAFGPAYSNHFIQLLPIRAFIGILIYLLLIQTFQIALFQRQTASEISEDESSSPEVKRDKNVEILERVAVKSGNKIHVVQVNEIVCLQADGDYVQIVTPQGKYLKEQTMKYFEEHLPESQFVRVHRSVIVNVEMISRIELYEKQNQLLTLKNGQQIKTSPAGYKTLRMVLNL